MNPNNENRALWLALLLALLFWVLGSLIPARVESQTLEHWAGPEWTSLSYNEKKAFSAGLLTGLWWAVQSEYVEAQNPELAKEFRDLVESVLHAYNNFDIVAALDQCYAKEPLFSTPIVPVLVELRKRELELLKKQRRK